VVLVSPSGLVTVTGGKWTTYRAIAEDVLEKCAEMRLLPRLAAGKTRDFPLIGASGQAVGQLRGVSDAPGLSGYGAEADQVMRLPGAERLLTAGLSEAMVRFAARFEYARTVEDVLARRSRLLFLDAALAKRLASQVGALLREETGVDPQIQAFENLASQYLALPT
jgi:glycerol-3-phosphate dehydrogenase